MDWRPVIDWEVLDQMNRSAEGGRKKVVEEVMRDFLKWN